MATLLLADDSVTIQRVIELTFADEGVRVVAVGDGESAIARIDQERPDIVLADVGMPGVDGYHVAAHIKRSPLTAHVPVLLLTGAFEPLDEERARETGCDGVLVKPFEPRQLIRTVRGLLAGERPADLWPEDMPRLEVRAPKPVVAAEVPEMPPTAPMSSVIQFPQAPALPPVIEPEPVEGSEPHMLSVPYEAETDPDLAAALARLEFVAVPDSPVIPKASEGPVAAAVKWDLSSVAAPESPKPSASANKSLANVFSALLAAERQHPEAVQSAVGSPALSEAAVEDVVQKVVRRMTDEKVRKIVLETAERLIREEIEKIKG